MKQTVGMYRFCSWLILIGLFTQSFTPLIAAVQSTSVKNQTIVGSVNEYVSVDDFNMGDIIVHVVEDAAASSVHENLSESLVRCYQRIIAGHATLHVDDVIEAMPELLQHAVMHPASTKVSSGESGVNSTFKDRAPRPSVNNANNAIFGCNGGCDLTQLIELLASIKERIGTVHDDPCCDSILGILGDACNVPCIGENSSISEVLCEILDCCTTVQSDIQTLTVEFNNIFTVLVDINDTLTECCDEIIIDIEDTQTLICDKFEQTWTILADLDVSVTVEVDLNGVFTVLEDVNHTLTECCDEIIIDIEDTQTLICDKFEQTWTILADLNDSFTVEFNNIFTVLVDINDTLTECCDEIIIDIEDTQTLICDKFEQTWTILDSIENKIDQLPTVTFMFTGTVVADLTGVFTVLDTIEQDILNSETLLCDKFQQTWTILADLNVTASVDLSGVYTSLAEIEQDIFDSETLLCEKFEQTWTILASLNFNLSATVLVDLNGVFTTLDTIEKDILDSETLICDKFEQTWTILDEGFACGPVPLFQTDVDSNGEIQLTETGINYCLAENITGTIIITGDNVTLDGNDRVVTGRVVVDAADIIVENVKVNPQAPVNNTQAAQAAIEVTPSGDSTKIRNCIIECPRLTDGATLVNGRNGIDDSGNKTFIIDTCVTAGSGRNLITTLASAGSGGFGVRQTGEEASIIRSIIQAGNGGSGTNGSTDGGAGGDGILQQGDNSFISNSMAIAGNGGNGNTSGSSSSGEGGDGGIGINLLGENMIIKHSKGVGGVGGNGGNVTGGNFGVGSGGNGGCGIKIEKDRVFIKKIQAIGGLGGNGGNGTSASIGGSGGIGGDGAQIIANECLIKYSVSVAGSGGIGGSAINAAGGLGGKGGNAVFIRGDSCIVDNVDCTGGDGGSAGNGVTGGAGGFGGNNIDVVGDACLVNRAICTVGNGGSGGDGSTTAGSGGGGGNGILANSTNVLDVIESVIVDGGAAGARGVGPGPSNLALGGDGIQLTGTAVNVQICQCKINNIGFGAEVTNLGSGIAIESDTNSVQVVSSKIISAGGRGIFIEGSNCSIQDCNINSSGTDGIDIASGAQCIQLTNNRVSCSAGIGINNQAAAGEFVFFNNVSTGNTGRNYVGVPNGFTCDPIVLTQGDVDSNGEIQLTETGINYCLAENITGTIVITGANVTLDGNDRVVTGRVVVDASEVIVENAKVQPQAPVDNADAANAGIEITNSSACVKIHDCVVKCGETTVGSVPGRTAVEDLGIDTLLLRVHALGGDSSMGAGGRAISKLSSGSVVSCTATAGDGPNAASGIGILVGADDIVVQDCLVINGGNGVSSSAAILISNGSRNVQIFDSKVLNFGIGVTDSNAIDIFGGDVMVRNCSIEGCGGNGFRIRLIASNVTVNDCLVKNAGVNGIDVQSGAQCIQLTNNRVSCSAGIGINNQAAAGEFVFFNNVSTGNTGRNYVGVPNGFTCDPIILTQGDVDSNGEIQLIETGINYCLAENITGTIIITGDNVTLDGNNRVVTGRVVVDALDVIVEHAKVQPQAPVNNTDAANAGVEITSTSSCVQIRECIVKCSDTELELLGTGINGRTGLLNDAPGTIIKKCYVQGGAGANSDNAGGNGGLGGIGIDSTASDVQILKSTGVGGHGGRGSGPTSTGRAGNSGIRISGDRSFVIQSIARAGDGGNGLADADGGGSQPALDILNLNNIKVQDCTTYPGNGGQSFGETGGGGGTGIRLTNVVTGIVSSCSVQGGGIGGSGVVMGTSGFGIFNSFSTDIQICECQINNVGGDGIRSSSGSHTQIIDCKINSADSIGILINDSTYQVKQCKVQNCDIGIQARGSDGQVVGCCANDNVTFGFDGIGGLVFANNIASSNGTNYTGVSFLDFSVVGSQDIGYWANVQP